MKKITYKITESYIENPKDIKELEKKLQTINNINMAKYIYEKAKKNLGLQ